jgi:hypothetical protein
MLNLGILLQLRMRPKFRVLKAEEYLLCMKQQCKIIIGAFQSMLIKAFVHRVEASPCGPLPSAGERERNLTQKQCHFVYFSQRNIAAAGMS